MLLSMTGFGEAHRKNDDLAVAAEVRTINSRYFKLIVRAGEGYSALEPQVEALVRQHIKRGTVQVSLRIDRARACDDYLINASVLSGYRQQLEELHKTWKLREPVAVESLLLLPGVVNQNLNSPLDLARDWPPVSEALQAAIECHDRDACRGGPGHGRRPGGQRPGDRAGVGRHRGPRSAGGRRVSRATQRTAVAKRSPSIRSRSTPTT